MPAVESVLPGIVLSQQAQLGLSLPQQVVTVDAQIPRVLEIQGVCDLHGSPPSGSREQRRYHFRSLLEHPCKFLVVLLLGEVLPADLRVHHLGHLLVQSSLRGRGLVLHPIGEHPLQGLCCSWTVCRRVRSKHSPRFDPARQDRVHLILGDGVLHLSKPLRILEVVNGDLHGLSQCREIDVGPCQHRAELVQGEGLDVGLFHLGQGAAVCDVLESQHPVDQEPGELGLDPSLRRVEADQEGLGLNQPLVDPVQHALV